MDLQFHAFPENGQILYSSVVGSVTLVRYGSTTRACASAGARFQFDGDFFRGIETVGELKILGVIALQCEIRSFH